MDSPDRKAGRPRRSEAQPRPADVQLNEKFVKANLVPLQHNPWDKREEEPDQAWNLFQTFLEMPARARSLTKLAVLTGRSLRTIENYAVRYRWNERLEAWEAWQRRLELVEKERSVDLLKAQIFTDEATDYEMLLSLWRAAYQKYFQRVTSSAAEPDMKELNRLVDMRDKIDQIIRRAAALPNNYQAPPPKAPPPPQEGEYMLGEARAPEPQRRLESLIQPSSDVDVEDEDEHDLFEDDNEEDDLAFLYEDDDGGDE